MNAVLQLLDSLPADQKPVLVTHSSGNHAQALALSAKTMGLQAYIAMPRNAPPVKKAAVKDYGATIVECGISGEVPIIAFNNSNKLLRKTKRRWHCYSEMRIFIWEYSCWANLPSG